MRVRSAIRGDTRVNLTNAGLENLKTSTDNENRAESPRMLVLIKLNIFFS